MISPKFVVVFTVIPAIAAALAVAAPFEAETSSATTATVKYTETTLAKVPQNYGEASEPIAVNAKGSVLFSYAGLLSGSTMLRPAEPSSGTAGTMINFAVNDNNQVVGQLQDTNEAAYWSGSDGAAWKTIDPSPVVPAGQSVVASRANVIDTAGEIAGYVFYHPSGSTSDSDLVKAGFLLSSPTATPVAVPVPSGGTGPAVIVAMNSGWELVTAGSTTYRVNRSSGASTAVSGLQRNSISADGTVLVTGGELHADGSTSGVSLASGSLYASGLSDSDTMLAADYSASNSPLVSFDSTGTRTDISAQANLTLIYGTLASNGRVAAEAYNSDGSATIYLFTPGPTTYPPVVNSVGDASATKSGTLGCWTGQSITVNGSLVPECTLRAAIQAENSGKETTKTITFSLPSGGSTIAVATALPKLTETGVTIDGGGGTATSTILDGTAISGSSVGLTVDGTKDTITGLAFSSWKTAILIDSAKGTNVVAANRIGVTTGTSDTGVQSGVVIDKSPNNLVGGTSADQGNVLSDLSGTAVFVENSKSTANRILNNLIGTTTDGTISQGVSEGVAVIDASKTTVSGNTILANGVASNGIAIGGSSDTVTGTTIQGNTIGLVANGTEIEPDSNSSAFVAGIEIGGRISKALIGGTGAGQGNVVTASKGEDIMVTGTSASGVSILGNRVGTNAAGMAVERYGFAHAIGIAVGGATKTTIGSSGGGGNTIVGCSGGEVVIQPKAVPMTLQSTGATLHGTNKTNSSKMSTVVRSNNIGVFADGVSVPDDGPDVVGVSDFGASDTIGPGNLIDWEEQGLIVGGKSDTVEGNLIGVDKTGLAALPNSVGVFVAPRSTSARIGVPGAARNTISGNVNGLVLGAKATVEGNLFGTSNLGNAAVAPYAGTLPSDIPSHALYDPVLLYVAAAGAGSTIGGKSSGDGNVISGSAGVGLALEGRATVEGNTVGVGLDGTTSIPNTGYGIYAGAAGSVIGAAPAHPTSVTVAGSNLIENNPTGVQVYKAIADVVIESNVISANGTGIQLEDGANPGVTVPTISTATQNGKGKSVVTFPVTKAQDGDLIQVFAATDCTAGSVGQGRALLGSATVRKAGVLSITVPLQAVGTLLTATLTASKHGTSTFATCSTVTAAP